MSVQNWRWALMASGRGNGTDPHLNGPLMRSGPVIKSLERWKYLNAALVLSVVLAIGTFYKFVISEATAQGKAGLAKAAQVEEKLDEHIRVETSLHDQQSLQIQQMQNAQAADTQALYRFLLTRERQPLLERKLDAGWARDAGP
jgi:hypothetical protein